MQKTFKILKGFIPSILIIIFGIYMIKTSDSIFVTIAGYTNIIFFGTLIFWAIIKIYSANYIKH